MELLRNVLKDWGHIVAWIALFQPWLIHLFNRFFHQGRIEIFETGTLEVGYSGYGATVALHGTLRAIHQDQFVRSIELTVTRLKDNARHDYDWGVFRARKLTVGRPEDITVELPYGFMVTTTQPHRFDIMFFDMALQGEARPYIEKVREGWTQAVLTASATTQTAFGE